MSILEIFVSDWPYVAVTFFFATILTFSWTTGVFLPDRGSSMIITLVMTIVLLVFSPVYAGIFVISVLFWFLIIWISFRLKNVFRTKAERRIERNQAIKREVASQIDTTNSLLVSYGLISKEDIEERPKMLAETQ